ncbi:hypothetical protein LIA77_07820 [Sarocladium implicatum]|nr:hypothetical protein LIA77_07820 [Sarocladium implicatum]
MIKSRMVQGVPRGLGMCPRRGTHRENTLLPLVSGVFALVLRTLYHSKSQHLPETIQTHPGTMAHHAEAKEDKPKVPSNQAAIDDYMKSYEPNIKAFMEVAAYVEEACRSALKASGILATVSSRAKEPGRLRTKLNGMTKIFNKPTDIDKEIMDIIGVRVLMYFPSQANEVQSTLEKLFGAGKDTKPIRDNRISAADLLKKMSEDEVFKGVDGPPKDSPPDFDPEKGYENTYGNYRAIHIRFTLQKGNLGETLKKKVGDREVKVEIQVQSLLMHTWSEVNHDIIYKPLSGTVTKWEMQLLDSLNGVGKLGELVLAQMKKAMDARMRSTKDKVHSVFELAEVIRMKLDLKETANGYKKPIGSTAKGMDLNMINTTDGSIKLQDSTPTKFITALNQQKQGVPERDTLGDVEALFNLMVYVQNQSIDAVVEALNSCDEKKKADIVNQLIPAFANTGVQKLAFDTPFLITAQNNNLTVTQKAEISANIIDMAFRPVSQAHGILPTDTANVSGYNSLCQLKLWTAAEPAMPRQPFPIDRKVLDQTKTQTEIRKSLEWLVARGAKDDVIGVDISNNLTGARIRAWELFSKPKKA